MIAVKETYQRLQPTAREISEVRWVDPNRTRLEVQVRRFRRQNDACRFANKLRRAGVRHVRVHYASVGHWREITPRRPVLDWEQAD